MAATQANPTAGPVTDEQFSAFHLYGWDRDVEFLKGVVLACGGLRQLQRSQSQAEIILHSRIFYYSRISGVNIPYVGYKLWLRANPEFGPVDWDLLDLICDKKDAQMAKYATPGASSSTAGRDNPEAQANKANWLHELYDGELYHAPAVTEESQPPTAAEDPSVPSWQSAAPKGELVVNQEAEGKDQGAEGGAPYPVRFAQIIDAIQSGKPVEGIQEIPNNLARNPDTTPFGRMAAPKKPWERARKDAAAAEEADSTVEIDRSFPKPDNSED